MNSVPSIGTLSTGQLLRSELRSGERLLWSGAPTPLRSAQSKWFDTVFGLAFSSVPLVIMSVTLKSLNSAAFGNGALPLLVVPPLMLGMGIWLTSSPLRAYFKSQRTSHGVTDQRLLTIVTGANTQCISRFARELGSVARIHHGDGTGTLRIEYGMEKDSKGRMQILKDEWCGLGDAKGAETAILSIMPKLVAAAPVGGR